MASALFTHENTSPNAEEALSLLSLPSVVTKTAVENAALEFLKMGVGKDSSGSVIIRSGALGAYVITPDMKGRWIDAFWSSAENIDKVVDVTGAMVLRRNVCMSGIMLTGS
jgi:hypothetical protein